MSASNSGWVEQGIGRVVGYVGRSERHRVGFVIGVSLLVFYLAVVRSRPGGGLVPSSLTVVLVLFLYTRPSARATVTAIAIGPALIFLALFLFRVIGPFGVGLGGYDPFTSILLRHAWLLVIGVPLLVFGIWFRRVTS
jgi:hypothetical protein